MILDILRRSFRPGINAMLTALIVVVLVGSAVAVAYSVHSARLDLQELQALEDEKTRLDVEWGQLLLEQHAWGAYGRIGKLAAEELQMMPPLPQSVVMVRQ